MNFHASYMKILHQLQPTSGVNRVPFRLSDYPTEITRARTPKFSSFSSSVRFRTQHLTQFGPLHCLLAECRHIIKLLLILSLLFDSVEKLRKNRLNHQKLYSYTLFSFVSIIIRIAIVLVDFFGFRNDVMWCVHRKMGNAKLGNWTFFNLDLCVCFVRIKFNEFSQLHLILW